MNLLTSSERDQIETHLAEVLARCFSESSARPMNRCVAEFVFSGGKRLRPQLCLWTYNLLSDNRPASTAVLDLACAWELFHSFLLAHDDVIDNSDRRRARASLHLQLASLDSGSLTFGKNLAIVAGDLLFSATMRLLADIDLPAETYRAVQRLFSRIACTTGWGQVLDICQSHTDLDDVQESVLMREYDWKTAAYTFEGPMLSGALLAGGDEATCQTVSRFAGAIGQAYQLHNDLSDLATPVHEGSDLMQGKRTVTLLRARSILPIDQRSAFDERFLRLSQGGTAALSAGETLRAQLHTSGAVDQTRQLIDQCLNAAGEALTAVPLTPAVRSGLAGLLDQMQSRYFSAV